MTIHDHDDPVNGSPLCWDCYDCDSAVVWQWWAPELWRRTTIALRRALAARARRAGVAACGQVASVQYAKVAEYQARGLVHFHALVRLDGPDGPGSPAPLDGASSPTIIQQAASAWVTYTAPPSTLTHGRGSWRGASSSTSAWSAHGHRTDDPDGPLVAEQVAGYLAKYATKDANSIRAPDQPRART